MGIFRGVGSFILEKGGKEVSLFRSPASDLNFTLAFAVISVLITNILGMASVGFFSHIGKFLNFTNPISFFIGILELVSEFVKVISLSFRLFGNIFAGEVVLHTISGMFAFIAPLPFLLLEVIVGFVQALVFSMLTLVFMVILTTPHHAEEEATEGVSSR